MHLAPSCDLKGQYLDGSRHPAKMLFQIVAQPDFDAALGPLENCPRLRNPWLSLSVSAYSNLLANNGFADHPKLEDDAQDGVEKYMQYLVLRTLVQGECRAGKSSQLPAKLVALSFEGQYHPALIETFALEIQSPVYPHDLT